MSDGPLQSLINGKQAEHISVRDRGFQYGDGCFETVRILARKPILWAAHYDRLRRACSALNLKPDFDTLQSELNTLLESNRLTDAVVKIIISRGEGGRGYTPLKQSACSRILQLFEYKAVDTDRCATVQVCSHRLSSNAQLAGIKHLNRLDQVLASAQIAAGFDEGICLDQKAYVVEGCRSNLCLVHDGKLLSPVLDRCGVEGVMLAHLSQQFEQLGQEVARQRISLQQLQEAEELFLCNSVFGVWPVAELLSEDGQRRHYETHGRRTTTAKDIAHELFHHAE